MSFKSNNNSLLGPYWRIEKWQCVTLPELGLLLRRLGIISFPKILIREIVIVFLFMMLVIGYIVDGHHKKTGCVQWHGSNYYYCIQSDSQYVTYSTTQYYIKLHQLHLHASCYNWVIGSIILVVAHKKHWLVVIW